MATTATTTATTTVQQFFDAYRRHDVDRMVALRTPEANFRYVPMGEGGQGRVRGTGDAFWRALIGAFPDLTNEVQWTTEDNAGNVFSRVVISGTQATDLGEIKNKGRRFTLEHLFICHVNRDGKIDEITAYWDNAYWFRQIGYTPT